MVRKKRKKPLLDKLILGGSKRKKIKIPKAKTITSMQLRRGLDTRKRRVAEKVLQGKGSPVQKARAKMLLESL